MKFIRSLICTFFGHDVHYAIPCIWHCLRCNKLWNTEMWPPLPKPLPDIPKYMKRSIKEHQEQRERVADSIARGARPRNL